MEGLQKLNCPIFLRVHHQHYVKDSGTVNILLNDGEVDWGEMTGGTKNSISFASGDGTAETDVSAEWTFTNAHFSEIPINLTINTPYVESGVNWKAETVSLASYTE